MVERVIEQKWPGFSFQMNTHTEHYMQGEMIKMTTATCDQLLFHELTEDEGNGHDSQTRMGVESLQFKPLLC